MVKENVRNDCFAFYEVPSGGYKCSALKRCCCIGCKFYKTKQEYIEKVMPLKHI